MKATSSTIGGVTVTVVSGIPAWAAGSISQRDRIRAAFLSSGLAWPLCRITAGTGADLPIALALLAATGSVTQAHAEEALAASHEGLNLDGSLRPCRFRDLTELLATSRPLGAAAAH